MKLRVLVEAIDDNGKSLGRRMRSIQVPKKRLMLIEAIHGEGALTFVVEEALTGAAAPFLASSQNPAEAAGLDPGSAPKNKLNEMLGLDIIESLDRKDGVAPAMAMPQPPPQQMAPPPGQMGMRPPPMSMSTRPGMVPSPGGRGFGPR